MGFYNQPEQRAGYNKVFALLVNEQESIRAPSKMRSYKIFLGLTRISTSSRLFLQILSDRSTRGDFYIQPVILSMITCVFLVKLSQKLVEEIMILPAQTEGELVQETHFSDYREVMAFYDLIAYQLNVLKRNKGLKLRLSSPKLEVRLTTKSLT